jgi:hypothetical protein
MKTAMLKDAYSCPPAPEAAPEAQPDPKAPRKAKKARQ